MAAADCTGLPSSALNAELLADGAAAAVRVSVLFPVFDGNDDDDDDDDDDNDAISISSVLCLEADEVRAFAATL